jgi:hypothetical protein
MLLKEIIAVYTESHTKPISLNAESLVTARGTCSYQLALNG